MKKTLFFLVSMLLGGQVSAQTIAYQPLHGNYTQYVYRSQHWNGSENVESFYKTIWSGDTTIGGENYVRIFQGGTYVGGIREDVPNQQRFFIDMDDMEHEITINPFLSVGDVLSDTSVYLKTFRTYFNPGPGMYEFFDTLTVDHIDSTLEDNGTYSTTYYLRKLPYPVSFIYNSYRGLLNFQTLEFNSDQICYREDGEQTPSGQQTPWTWMCDLGMNENDLLRIELFPNPASESLNISGDLGLITDLTIYDVSGTVIKQVPLSESHSEISLKELKSGVYLLSVNENKQVLRFQKM